MGVHVGPHTIHHWVLRWRPPFQPEPRSRLLCSLPLVQLFLTPSCHPPNILREESRMVTTVRNIFCCGCVVCGVVCGCDFAVASCPGQPLTIANGTFNCSLTFNGQSCAAQCDSAKGYKGSPISSCVQTKWQPAIGSCTLGEFSLVSTCACSGMFGVCPQHARTGVLVFWSFE